MPMGYRSFALTRVGARLFFNAEAPGLGYGLWTSDGTAEGTRFASRLNSTDLSPEYWDLTAMNDMTLLFIARTGRLNYGIYRSDGTEAGTQLVKDISYQGDSGALRLYPPVSGLAAIGGYVYFHDGLTLMQTDGTPAGTGTITQFLPGPVSGIGGQAYFLSLSQPYGFDLARVGSYMNDTVVATVAPTLYLSGSEGHLAPVGARLFIAVNGTGGHAELWVSDGTLAGTLPVLALRGRLFGQSDGVVGERPAGAFGARLVFLADDGVHGGEPWVSDGTPAGTFLLKDINP